MTSRTDQTTDERAALQSEYDAIAASQSTTPEANARARARMDEIRGRLVALSDETRIQAFWRALSDDQRIGLMRLSFVAGDPDSWEDGERRVALIQRVTEGYCRDCGRKRNICYCENDE